MRTRRTPETEAQKEVAQVAEKLSGLKARLKRTVETLPEARPSEADHDPDFATELRSIIECVIADSLDPAILDLEAAAKRRPEGPEERVSRNAGRERPSL